jgi:hypothetical protein
MKDRFYEEIEWVFRRLHEVKGKVVPVLPLTEHHATKAYWESGGTVPPIL